MTDSDQKLVQDLDQSLKTKIMSCKKFLPTKKIFENNFEQFCGFTLDNLTNFDTFVQLLHRPTNPASLGVVRALFGVCMVLDVVEERGLADIDLKWGDPHGCHFPLIHGMKPPRLPWMIVLYTIMWLGAFGIMLGLRFKLACACFVLPYWYIFLLDKTYWNNHTYLYGLVSTILWTTDANRYFSLDAELTKKPASVPLWNYFILKFQFFILYFLAGLKKSSREWLEGYSMINLAHHWVFDPFKIFLTTEQTDFLIVHWFAFIFDLTVGFWMLFEKTRIPAMVFCAAFHLMNSRLFSIGMFPYVCLATMPLYANVNWPNSLMKNVSKIWKKIDSEKLSLKNESTVANPQKPVINEPIKKDDNLPDIPKLKKKIESIKKPKKSTTKQKFVVSMILIHVGLQFFLPYSHFVTKGYNNWVSGLYGYSWDMMVHSWDTILIIVRVHDNVSHEDHFIDPQAWVQSDKWSKHGDMVVQYAQCLKENLLKHRKVQKTQKTKGEVEAWPSLSSNLSIFIDVRCSLNGRLQQRVFDPNVDMLTVDWHPLKPVSFLMPLLTQFSSYRNKMDQITEHVYTWSNYTDVLFVAEYPGLRLENYFTKDFSNVSLTVLEGEVAYSEENWPDRVTVSKERSVAVTTGKMHEITTTSPYPSCFMYTYMNKTREQLELSGSPKPPRKRSGFPILKELKYKAKAWWRALGHIANAFFNLAYNVPMVRRVPRTLNYFEDYY